MVILLVVTIIHSISSQSTSYVSITRDGQTSSYFIDHENNKAQYKSSSEPVRDPSKFRATVIMTSRGHSAQPRNEFESSTFRIVVDDDNDLQSASSSNVNLNDVKVVPLESPNTSNRDPKSANLTDLRDLSLAHYELEIILKRNFSDSINLIDSFMTYLDEKSVSLSDVRKIQNTEMFYNDEIVKTFSEDRKLQEVLKIVANMTTEDAKMIKESWTPVILDEISVEMLFNRNKLEEFLYEKIENYKIFITTQKSYFLENYELSTERQISSRDVLSHLNGILPENPSANLELLSYASRNNINLNELMKSKEELFNSENNLINDFVNDKKLKFMISQLQRTHGEKWQEKLEKINDDKILNRISIEMIYDEGKMSEFLHKNLQPFEEIENAKQNLEVFLDTNFPDAKKLNEHSTLR